MTKFFRYIRQRLLSESKNMKYLQYAIGEIMLVVVGILIALYLNNWNQNRVDKKEEAILKDAIAKKIEFNSFQHRTGLEIYEAALHSAKTLVKLSGKPVDQCTRVQIEQSLFDLRKRFLMGKSNQISIYDELISSGKLNLLASKELRQNLTSLKGNLQLLASYEDDQTNFVDNHLSPFLNYNCFFKVTYPSLRNAVSSSKLSYSEINSGLTPK